MANRKRNLTVLWAVPAILAVGGAVAYAANMMGPAPADLDYATTQQSAAGTFTATIEPPAAPIAMNQIHTWTIDVSRTDGTPVDVAEITVDGGMPQHGHGLPTTPQVTKDLGGGRFEVEGMKFNMPGWWVVNVHVGDDEATFNLSL
jgi:hypothetical protein